MRANLTGSHEQITASELNAYRHMAESRDRRQPAAKRDKNETLAKDKEPNARGRSPQCGTDGGLSAPQRNREAHDRVQPDERERDP